MTYQTPYGILLLRLCYEKIQKSEISIRTPDNGWNVSSWQHLDIPEEIPQPVCIYSRLNVLRKRIILLLALGT